MALSWILDQVQNDNKCAWVLIIIVLGFVW